MARYDRITSLIWMALGIVQCIESSLLGLGSVSEPGTGFMPFVVGLAVILLAVFLFVEASVEGRRGREKAAALWADVHWKRVVYITILLLAYSLLLPKLGFLLATFLVIVLLLKSGETVKWHWAVLVGAITSGFSYLVFGVWLSVAFPAGILKF